MSADNTKIVERVQKLLALANHPGTGEHEADAALGMAQKLLEEHNLSMAQVESHQAEGRLEEILERSAMYDFQRDLMSTLCDVNFCLYWVSETRRWSSKTGQYIGKKRHNIVGRESNVATVVLMFDYILKTVERLCPWQHPQNLSKSAISWKEGCVWRIRERLKERREAADKESQEKAQAPHESASANALVVLADVRQSEEDLNKDFRMGRAPGTSARLRAEREAEQRKEAERLANMSQEEREALEEAMAKAQAEWEKEEARWQRKWEKRWDQKDMGAFWNGHKKGDDVGLDAQLDTNKQRRLS